MSDNSPLLRAHIAALQPIFTLVPGESMAIPFNDLKIDLLRDIVHTYNVGKKLFLILAHEDLKIFEVACLPIPGELAVLETVSIDDAINYTKEFLLEYLQNPLEKYASYDKRLTEAMKEARLISTSALQVRLYNARHFARAPEGRLARFDKVTKVLVKQGCIELLPKEIAKQYYNTGRKLIRILNV